MPNPGISDDTLAAIQGRLLSGEKPKEIAQELGVSPATISRAKAKIQPELLARMDEERSFAITDMVLQQLESGLEASITIANQVQDEDWRRQQDAAKLATLYGVITDKNIRLLEAQAAAQDSANRTGQIEESGSVS